MTMPARSRPHSYTYLRKKAGLSEPTGLATIKPIRPMLCTPSIAPRGRVVRKITAKESNKEALRVELAKMVAAGVIVQTADGRYQLP